MRAGNCSPEKGFVAAVRHGECAVVVTSRPAPRSETDPVVAPRTPDAGGQFGLRHRLAYGIGAMGDNIGLQAVKQNAGAIYNIELGLNPLWIGVALSLGRAWDALADIAMGAISDNARLRWGRRRPFILAGGVGCAVTFPLIWFAARGWSEPRLFGYLLASTLLFYTAYTVFSVPLAALGYEVAPTRAARTNLMAFRTVFIALSGLINNWMFPVIQLGIFGNTVESVRTVGLLLGGIFIVSGVLPALVLREPALGTVAKQPPVPLGTSLRRCLRNRAFCVVAVVFGIMMLTHNLIHALGIYVNIYHVYGGDAKAAAWVQGIGSTVFQSSLLAAIPFFTRAARRWGPEVVLRWALGAVLLASIGKWFCYTPAHPWLQLVVFALLGPGISGTFMLVNLMVADTCDLDETTTGQRREAMYGAIAMWINKACMTVALLLSGVFLVATGFRVELGGHQAAGTMLTLRLLFATVPATGTIAAFFVLRRYPLTRERMAEVSRRLAEIRGAGGARTDSVPTG